MDDRKQVGVCKQQSDWVLTGAQGTFDLVYEVDLLVDTRRVVEGAQSEFAVWHALLLERCLDGRQVALDSATETTRWREEQDGVAHYVCLDGRRGSLQIKRAAKTAIRNPVGIDISIEKKSISDATILGRKYSRKNTARGSLSG